MDSVSDHGNVRIKAFWVYLNHLRQFNDQWSNPHVAKSFIHATNDEAAESFMLRHRENTAASSDMKRSENDKCKKEAARNKVGKDKQSNPKRGQKMNGKERPTEDGITKTTLKKDPEREKKLSSEKTDSGIRDALLEYPFAMKRNEELGRYLVSTRDILAGEVLLLEAPLVMGPNVRYPFVKSTPCCVHCYRATCDYLCSECGFYLCRERCKELHPKQEECIFLRKLKLTKEQQHIHSMENRNFAEIVSSLAEKERPESLQMIAKAYLTFVQEEKLRLMKYYSALPTLKTICLLSRSRAFASLISSLHGEVDPTLQRYKINQNTIVNIIKKLDVPYDEAFIHRIADIWDTNAFEVKLTRLPTQALFTAASLLTHSCKPNCEHNFSAHGIMVLRAVENIPSDTILTLSYTDKIWPTYIRRDHLRLTKKFICNCERCLDPTECGTFIGHIKCEACGHLSVSACYGEELCSSINCTHCTCSVFAKEFFKTEAAACSLFGNCSVKTLGEFEGVMSNLEEIFKGRYHNDHHLVQRLRMEMLFENSQTDFSCFATEELQRFEAIANATYEWCRVLPRLSQQKVRVAREWILLRKELYSRKGIPAEQDEELKVATDDAKLALHWEQRLPQVI